MQGLGYYADVGDLNDTWWPWADTVWDVDFEPDVSMEELKEYIGREHGIRFFDNKNAVHQGQRPA